MNPAEFNVFLSRQSVLAPEEWLIVRVSSRRLLSSEPFADCDEARPPPEAVGARALDALETFLQWGQRWAEHPNIFFYMRNWPLAQGEGRESSVASRTRRFTCATRRERPSNNFLSG